MVLVVHPHFHPRRTGVTRHVESVVPALGALVETRAIGATLAPGLPRSTWREVIRRARTEAVIWHAHRNNELLAGLLLRALRPRLRVVFTRHAATRAGWYTRWLARRADARIALNEDARRAFGLAAELVPHGLELAAFHPPEDRARAWAELGVGPSGSRGIGVVGRVRPAKGQGDFVRALAPLLREHPDWVPVLVGAARPADRPFLADLVRDSGGSLRSPGEQQDVARWYRGLTIVVQPSHQESFGLVTLEALASGCCVVATRLPAAEQLIDPGRTGFLYPAGDVEALRALLRPLLADPALAGRIGAAAAAAARPRFGVEHEARALHALYRRLEVA